MYFRNAIDFISFWTQIGSYSSRRWSVCVRHKCLRGGNCSPPVGTDKAVDLKAIPQCNLFAYLIGDRVVYRKGCRDCDNSRSRETVSRRSNYTRMSRTMGTVFGSSLLNMVRRRLLDPRRHYRKPLNNVHRIRYENGKFVGYGRHQNVGNFSYEFE